MATWTKNKVNASDVNGGNQFNSGDGVRNTDINKIFESGLYSQDVIENIDIGTVTTSASGSSASASITYNASGYPRINLTLPRGEKGEQGEPGSVGSIAVSIFSGTVGNNTSVTLSNPGFTYNKMLVYIPNYNKYYIVPSSGWKIKDCWTTTDTPRSYGEMKDITGFMLYFNGSNRISHYMYEGNIDESSFSTASYSNTSITIYALNF